MYRTAEGRQRRFTIGRAGAPWTPETARAEAQRILGAVAAGEDPAADKHEKRHASTVADLCDAYMADAEAGTLLTRRGEPKRPGTLLSDRGRITLHIKPLLGTMKVGAVTRTDIESFMNELATGKTACRGGPGVASRTVGLLGAIFTYAVHHDMRQDNPVRGIVRRADGLRDRRLSHDEYRMLGRGLRAAAEAKMWPPAVSCMRFLALTGWRSGEALTLRWEDIDLSRRTAILPNTKTGRSMRPLANAACDLLRSMPRVEEGGLVFPPSRGERTMSGFRKYWNRVAKRAGIPDDVTPHTLRHSFASLAADLEYSESTIGALIGHKRTTVTARYIHSADSVLLAAADRVARRASELIDDAASGDVVKLSVAS